MWQAVLLLVVTAAVSVLVHRRPGRMKSERMARALKQAIPHL